MMGLLLGGVATGCIIVLYPFFSALLWAAILTFTTWPVYRHLQQRSGRYTAAALMMILTALLVVLPLTLVASAGIEDAPGIARAIENALAMHLPEPPRWVAGTPLIGRQVAQTWTKWSADLSAAGAFVQPYLGSIASRALNLLVQIASGLLQLVLALFIGFFFWILGTAIVQGILTGIGFAIAHVPSPVLFGGIAAFFAVLPIGAPLVWVPAAIWLALTHHLAWGIVLGVYGVVAISGADHVIRPVFISRGAQLPYLLTVLGVLGGVLAFGGLGIFLGPVLLGVGYTLAVEFAATGRSAKEGEAQDAAARDPDKAPVPLLEDVA